MKANELMIGDFVHIAGFIEPRDHVITAIKPDEDGHYFVLLDEDDTWWDIACLAPIPLTPEILEKNGFVKRTSTHWIFSDDYYDIIIKEWSDSIYVFKCEDLEISTPFTQLTFSYVHELQHALHLCGIEKEIVL